MAPPHAYPRPQLRRGDWTCLNGEWEFAIDPQARWTVPEDVAWRTGAGVFTADTLPEDNAAALRAVAVAL